MVEQLKEANGVEEKTSEGILNDVKSYEKMGRVVENYRIIERNIVEALEIGIVDHHLTTGSYREEVWREMFERIIPRKFAIEQSVFIVDSNARVSREVDLVIFDEQYTPYVFRHGNIKYIPIEAVAVVVQCKSKKVVFDDLNEWVKSITNLRTSSQSVVRTVSGILYGQGKSEELISGDKQSKASQTATRPIRILCHMENKTSADIQDRFDISICLSGDRLRVKVSKEEEYSLERWCHELNHASEDSKFDNSADRTTTLKDFRVGGGTIASEEVSLLSLTIQLNQLLMLINNPMFFPHIAYVKMFNDVIDNVVAKDKKKDSQTTS
ncbi:hypothetical protein M6D81_22225 [Paenibacillus sp. J5C_2022]|uniref:DUF6602 domain-containing protein n=1 Tax=Paenibacillus sp. J5C2022 TaxID=2977129 RepID=UPI0021CF92EB|nr:DUF6602 domain-containing protein [Paenibacillus sp. J5C2022]MCU6711416.1 hypothetical protein [Paenibacillus sp. J5C2022]